MRALTLIRTDPSLRIIAVLMVLTGALTCSFGPDAALLAVKIFGLGDRGYALLPATSTLLSVAACALSVFGIALMVVAPGRVRFFLAHGGLLPLSSTCFGQLFARARLAAQRQPAAERAAIMSTIRALLALPYVAVLPSWALGFGPRCGTWRSCRWRCG